MASIRFLVSSGCPVDPANHNGHTPLALIEDTPSNARLEVAAFLLSNGANPSAQAGHHGGALLHRAVMRGDIDLARLLLERGADVDAQDWSGKTPLHHAVSRNQSLVKLILEHSPKLAVKARGRSGSETAIGYARRLGKAAVVALLETAT